MDNLNFNYGTSLNLASAGVTAGTGATISTATTTNVALNGKFGTPLAPQTNAALPVVDSSTGLPFIPVLPNFCCCIVIGVTAAGALTMSQSTPIACGAGLGAVPGALILEPQMPEMPSNAVALAYTIVRNAPSGTPSWTPGTSSWAATGLAYSAFQNVLQLPNRPQAS